ncbi:MAG: hypothetical protein A2Y40_03465 [Candidatus Margulisbacteria bacterium GWF2_35_9]|nr:MAG: hypothetical protein A2Y40_03465 [Candidatus Margulisbacteria bacterium GWF2_35_9]
MFALLRLPIMILTPVTIGVIAQLLFKQGMMQMGEINMMSKGIFLQYFKIFTNPWVFLGLCMYFLSTVFWLYLISKVPLSFAYPMLSLGYVFVALASWLIYKEPLSFINWAGIVVIMVGVILISQGKA